MTDNARREEVDQLLSRADELIGKTPVNWQKVRELMDKLRAVVREAELRDHEGGAYPPDA